MTDKRNALIFAGYLLALGLIVFFKHGGTLRPSLGSGRAGMVPEAREERAEEPAEEAPHPEEEVEEVSLEPSQDGEGD